MKAYEITRPAGTIRVSPSALTQVVLQAAEAADGARVPRPRRGLELTIADSGRGFDIANVAPRPGHGAGLPGMRERANLVGGELTVEEEQVLDSSVEAVVCRWCSASGAAIEEIPLPSGGDEPA